MSYVNNVVNAIKLSQFSYELIWMEFERDIVKILGKYSVPWIYKD